MALILKGVEVSKALNEKTALLTEKLRADGIVPTLAILRVGESPDDIYYENSAVKRCDSVGIDVRKITLPLGTTQAEVSAAIISLNEDESVHGVLMMRPLPKPLDDKAAADLLAPEKDIDGITEGSMAGVFTGSGKGFAPCTAQACMEIIDHYGVETTGKTAVVIGRSLVVGKPAAMMLIAKNATVTVCHTKTVDMPAVARNADILIVAAGHANTVDASFTNPSQTVIDVGINVGNDGKMCGDVSFDSVEPACAAITPVPGGVGGVTTAVLAANVAEATRRQTKK